MLLHYLIGIMILWALLGALGLWIVMDVQLAAWRSGRSVQAHVQQADQRVQDVAHQAQTEILRHVIEARVRDRYRR